MGSERKSPEEIAAGVTALYRSRQFTTTPYLTEIIADAIREAVGTERERWMAEPSAELVEAAAKAGFESMAATMLEKGYSRKVHRFEHQSEDVMADWRSVAARVIAAFQRIRSGE